MISFPKTIEAAAAGQGSLRAGGTDLQELRHLGVHQGDLIDLRDVALLDRFDLDETGLHLGAGLTLSTIAADPRVIEGFPGLAQAAGGLATPQIRNRATLAGSLLQEVRCWYYRNPLQTCAKKGGAVCLARQGDHLFHACFDRGLCVAPHPSTMAMALLAYDAQVELQDGSRLDITALLGDGSDPRRTHALTSGQVVVAVHVPQGEPKERAAYGRAISRARAEWPLVEVIARIWLDKKGKKITDARVAIGGVANRPFSLPAVEAALVEQEPTEAVLAAAAALANQGASPLPMTAYKVKLIPGIVQDVLLRALGDGLVIPPPPPAPEAPGEVKP